MATQAAQVAGSHPRQRRPAAARRALHLQALGVHGEAGCGPGRSAGGLQGEATTHTLCFQPGRPCFSDTSVHQHICILSACAPACLD